MCMLCAGTFIYSALNCDNITPDQPGTLQRHQEGSKGGKLSIGSEGLEGNGLPDSKLGN